MIGPLQNAPTFSNILDIYDDYKCTGKLAASGYECSPESVNPYHQGGGLRSFLTFTKSDNSYDLQYTVMGDDVAQSMLSFLEIELDNYVAWQDENYKTFQQYSGAMFKNLVRPTESGRVTSTSVNKLDSDESHTYDDPSDTTLYYRPAVVKA